MSPEDPRAAEREARMKTKGAELLANPEWKGAMEALLKTRGKEGAKYVVDSILLAQKTGAAFLTDDPAAARLARFYGIPVMSEKEAGEAVEKAAQAACAYCSLLGCEGSGKCKCKHHGQAAREATG